MSLSVQRPVAPPTPTSGWRLSRFARLLILVIHDILAVGWIGIWACLIALGLTGLYTRDPALLKAAYLAAGLFGSLFITPVSLGTLVTGLLLSFGTKWGLVRYYWVLVKFVLTLILTVGSNFILKSRLHHAVVQSLQISPQQTSVGEGREIVHATLISISLLLAATVLSIYKPWGKTRFG